MKKHIIAFAAALVSAICLVGCDKGGEQPVKSPYDSLNDMIAQAYSRIDLTVETTRDDLTLTSTYAIVYTKEGATVTYSVERLAEISLGDVPGSPVVTLTGKAAVIGGKVTVIEGEDVGLPATIAENGLTFKAGYFKNASITDTSLQAEVADPKGFFGTAVSCSDMKVEASFADAFSEISVTYTTADEGNVEYLYKFTV